MSELIKDHISEEIISLCEDIVLKEGTKNINVRRVITAMGVTNRVFYNRFHNIEEVLECIYYKNMVTMQHSLSSEKNIEEDFFGYVTDVALNALLNTYDVKQRFCQYMFEFESYTNTYCNWWIEKIKDVIETAKRTEQIKKDIDSEMLSYALWCFLHGFNTDAVNRNVPKSDAVKSLKFGLECLFYGVKN
ncbi:MAG: TetR/AcrR family transcriptional regulator [Clostridia bacterium]